MAGHPAGVVNTIANYWILADGYKTIIIIIRIIRIIIIRNSKQHHFLHLHVICYFLFVCKVEVRLVIKGLQVIWGQSEHVLELTVKLLYTTST